MTTISSMISTAPGELGLEASAAVRDITRRIANGRTSTMLLADDLTASWAALTQGGWDSIGIREGADGATLLDLVAVAQVWGEMCLPLPLIPTILAKRWSETAAAHNGPVTLAVPHAADGPADAGALVPFANFAGIRLCEELTDGSTQPLAPVGVAAEDDLAPTLVLGRRPQPSKFAPEAAHECAVVWGAEAVGAARRMLDDGVAYAKLREQFGTAIGRFQAVKHLLAEAHMLVEQAETAVLWAATSPGDAPRALRFAFGACRVAGEKSMQVHGGVGFTWELGLHFYLRHVLALNEASAAVLA